ncbi:MAG: carboxypeptidase regulatory-like domain-containing protein [Planctomycetota bacterium]
MPLFTALLISLAPLAPAPQDGAPRRLLSTSAVVTDSDGLPVEGAVVEWLQFEAQNPEVPGWTLARATTNERGWAQLERNTLHSVVSAWPTRLRAQGAGLGTSPAVAPIAGGPVRLVLGGSGELVGQVVDPSGAPLPGVRVSARHVDGGEVRIDEPVGLTRSGLESGPQGEFRITGLRPGRYAIAVAPEGERESFEVAGSPLTTGGEFHRLVAEWVELRVRAVDALETLLPLVDAQAGLPEIGDSAQLWSEPLGAAPHIDFEWTEGALRAMAPAGARYRLTAMDAERGVVTRTVEVASGSPHQSIEFRLEAPQPRATLEVELVRAAGSQPVGVTTTVRPTGTERYGKHALLGRRTGSGPNRNRPWGDGVLTFELPPGEWTVNAEEAFSYRCGNGGQNLSDFTAPSESLYLAPGERRRVCLSLEPATHLTGATPDARALRRAIRDADPAVHTADEATFHVDAIDSSGRRVRLGCAVGPYVRSPLQEPVPDPRWILFWTPLIPGDYTLEASAPGVDFDPLEVTLGAGKQPPVEFTWRPQR